MDMLAHTCDPSHAKTSEFKAGLGFTARSGQPELFTPNTSTHVYSLDFYSVNQEAGF